MISTAFSLSDSPPIRRLYLLTILPLSDITKEQKKNGINVRKKGLNFIFILSIYKHTSLRIGAEFIFF